MELLEIQGLKLGNFIFGASRSLRFLMVMLMVKRSRLEIMAEIVNFCIKPQTKTRVMYRANLPWRTTQKYLSQLQSWGLLEVHHSPTKYATTQKGIEFIKKWRQLAELL